MQVVESKAELRRELAEFRRQDPRGTVGFVPTMGALHQGHAALVRQAADECDLAAVSIFVNPTQFNDSSDLARYPRTPAEDLELCRAAGAHVVFMPSAEEMLPEGPPRLRLSMAELTGTLCGPGRPGHFEGVLYIVARLFHLFGPDRAYFGKKDYQQFRILHQMARELDFPVEVVGCETVREEDGLAMSSRNQLLRPRPREHAELIFRALRLARQTFEDRGTRPADLAEIVGDVIASGTENEVEYVDVVHPFTLERLTALPEDADFFVIGVGVHCGGVRLIDNIEIPV